MDVVIQWVLSRGDLVIYLIGEGGLLETEDQVSNPGLSKRGTGVSFFILSGYF